LLHFVLVTELRQFWYGLTKDDPLYLFTVDNFRKVVSNNFRESLSPLFTHLEAVYGPPLRFKDGKPVPDYRYNFATLYGIPVTDGMLAAKNFKYEWEEKRDKPQHIRLLREDLEMSGSGGSASFCSLTVTVPRQESNEFWRRNLYAWDPPPVERHCEFKVESYGATTTEACWRATRNAIEWIRCIRENTVPCRPSTPPSESDCPALKVAEFLHCEFEKHNDMFDSGDVSEHTKFWNGINKYLSDQIEKERKTQSKLQYLWEYYQVYDPGFGVVFI
jgi:hypothetical protein